jgi:hypothetical protein
MLLDETQTLLPPHVIPAPHEPQLAAREALQLSAPLTDPQSFDSALQKA